ncbi:unnamed protein product [Ambrosiozyma monospora]|uniref:Unnamed protein product n=1 Tax=Ambrosiozyma monospora TaxID=43982 RepID=A0ACB5STD6_AMBMO|nr:unnamed protein product [Ambrosiozyma monospora]
MTHFKKHKLSDTNQEKQHDQYNNQIVQTQETTCSLPSLSKSIEDESNKLNQYLPDYGKYALFKKAFLLKLTFIVILISLANTVQGYITAFLNVCQMQPAFLHYTGNPTGAVLGAINTAPELGGVITLGISSHLSDNLGRRTPLIIGSVFVLIAVVLQSCAQNYAMFLIGGLFNGFGGSIGQVAATSLVSEVSYPPYRQVMSVICSTSWFIGANLAAWIGYGVKDVTGNWCWRIIAICGVILPAIQLSFIWMIPESPRWLVSKDRDQDARKMLIKYHGDNNEEVAGELVDFEMCEIKAAIQAERVASNYKYSDLFKTTANRKRLFLTVMCSILLMMSGNSVVSFYINKILESIGYTSRSQKILINAGMMVYSYGVSLLATITVGILKRRTSFLTTLSMMLVSYVIWTALSAINQQNNFKDKSYANGVLAMVFLFILAYEAGFNAVPWVYLTEIFPFTIRAKGLNIFCTLNLFWLALAGFVNPVALDAIGWKYYLVFVAFIVFDMIVVFFTFVETSGKTLEEIAEVFGEPSGEMQPISTIPASGVN